MKKRLAVVFALVLLTLPLASIMTSAATGFTVTSTTGTVAVKSGCTKGFLTCELTMSGNATFTPQGGTAQAGTYATDVTFDFTHATKGSSPGEFCNVAVSGTGSLTLGDGASSTLDGAIPAATTSCVTHVTGVLTTTNVAVALTGASGSFAGTTGTATITSGTWDPAAHSGSLAANGSYAPTSFTITVTGATVTIIQGCVKGNPICEITLSGAATFTPQGGTAQAGTYSSDVTFDFTGATKGSNPGEFCNVAVVDAGKLVLNDAASSTLNGTIPSNSVTCVTVASGVISIGSIAINLSGMSGLFAGTAGTATLRGSWDPAAHTGSIDIQGSYGPATP